MFDFLSSIFTPRGTNARRKQEQGQQAIGDQASGIANSAGQNYADVLRYLQGQNRNIQGGIDRLGQSTTRAGLRDNAIRGGQAARSAALSQSVPLQYQQNPWMAQAYRSQQMNRANDQSNQAIQKSTDPATQANALGMLMQAISSYQNQSYTPYGQAAGLVYGQPQVQVQPGLMDQLGGVIGMVTGGQSTKGGSSTQGKASSAKQSAGTPLWDRGNDSRFMTDEDIFADWWSNS